MRLNYLPMFKRFPSAETKRGRPCDTKELLMFNYLRPPHLPQTHVGRSAYFLANLGSPTVRKTSFALSTLS